MSLVQTANIPSISCYKSRGTEQYPAAVHWLFKNNQMGTDVRYQGSSSQQKLVQTMLHRSLLCLRPKKMRTRIRTSREAVTNIIIIGEQLTPEAMGALLAHFENKVMFKGFVWEL